MLKMKSKTPASENPNEDVRAFRSLTHVMRAGVLREQRELAYR